MQAMKVILKNKIVLIIAIVLLVALFIGLLSKLFISSKDGNNVPSVDSIYYSHYTHNGGAYYNSNYSGIRYAFNEGDSPLTLDYGNNKCVSSVVHGYQKFLYTQMSGKGTYGFYLEYLTKPNSSDFYYVDYVLEFDMCLDFNITIFGEAFSLRLFEGSYFKNFYWILDRDYKGDYYFKICSSLDDGIIAKVWVEDWNNYRFVYHFENEKFYIKMYLNGSLISEFDIEYAGEAYMGVDSPFVYFDFLPSYFNDSVYLDNIFLGYRFTEKSAK